MIKRQSNCAMVALPIPIWNAQMTDLFYQLIDDVRRHFIEDAKNPDQFMNPILVGARTYDDRRVFEVVRSNCTVIGFKLEAITWIYNALLYCAEMDAWYATEKKFAEPNENEAKFADQPEHQ